MRVRKDLDEHEDHVLTEVRESGDYYELGTGGCWLAVKKTQCQRPPQVGQVARYYGRGFGHPVRGVDIDGVEVYYETETDHRARLEREQAERDREAKAKADANRPALDARVAALPDCFQKRIARFRRNDPNFYWNHEGYEMSACVDAVKIADACGSAEEVRKFAKLGWNEQTSRVPSISDGHSGNTFGMACRLAHHYLADPRLVFAEHAAISPLLGCEGAGCPPVTDDEMREAGYEPFERTSEAPK